MQATQILDVRLAEDYEAAHIRDAQNNCVFEVDFESRLPDTAPSKDIHTLVYGANDQSQEAAMAVEKMRRLGYTDVHVLSGGIAKIRSSELVTGEPLPSPPQKPDGRYVIDTLESNITWTGRNVINRHTGTVGIQKGELVFQSGEMVGGEVVLDMTDLSCSDLAGNPAHDVLTIDRTDWNVIYGSRRFFHRLAGHIVNDEIQIELRILTKPF